MHLIELAPERSGDMIRTAFFRIRKTYTFIFPVIFSVALFSCGQEKTAGETEHSGKKLDLEYAEQFSVYCNDDGSYEIYIADGQKFLLLPEDVPEPETTDITILHQPVENIYAGASSAVDLFDGIGVLDEVKMTSTKSADWRLPAVENAIEKGSMLYVGKYNAPDYETILSEDCGLALESTMIYHSPETKEQLESLGIPVMVERSSYETHPLGRLEWIKLYGLLTGKEKEAEDFFSEKMKIFDEVSSESNIPDGERQTVAFFYITSNGYANVRKTGDYISKMIELAGGKYIFTAQDLNADENALSTMNMEIETFYEKAREADCIIYNSTIDGELENLSQLIEKNELLKDFKAVKNNNVWCTGKNMFQQTTGMCDMIHDIHMVVTGKTNGDDLEFLKRLE
ncbi:MAG: ABC transporter substrate-binding protein [Ruminococcus flavefaciens]|nr:ABC transporter substrate-binding protein [Ruminococcus flavefaciens]